MSNNIKCSVVIPVYNAEKFIEQTLNSVINQTVKDIEIICVDDCSTDNSVSIIEKMQKVDSRIRLIKNDKNVNVSETRNNGIQNANSDLIALLDADDYWDPEFLETMLKRKYETNGQFIHSSYRFITNEGKILDSVFMVDDSITYKKLFKQNKILPSGVLIEKQLLLKHPFTSPELHEDFLCWLNILKDINIAYGVKKPLVFYRLTDNSRSRNKFKAIIKSYKTYKQHGVKFFKRCYYTICNAINGLRKYSKIK